MSITVSGTGRAVGAPDTLLLTIGIGLERQSVATAREDAARLATALIEALRNEGVPDAGIQTANYSIYPVYDHRNDVRRLLGYRVSNEVRVEIHELESVGRIIDRAAGAGGDEVVLQGVSFRLEDDALLSIAAREAAWRDARTKAEQLAGLAGLRLGDPTSISESSSAPAPSPRYAMEAAGAPPTPIQAGELEVAVTIEVTFGLE